MLVKEVMTRNIECVDAGARLSDVAGMMRKRGVDCLPVEEGGRLVGTISDRDITERAVARGRDPALTPAAKVMSKGFAWCFDDDGTDRAVRIMEAKHTRRLVVLDHRDHMVGILGLGDLALGAAHAFTSDMTVAAYDDYYGWSRRG